jgi:hypothetical protein
MTDVSTVRVIPFCGRVDEWPVWSEIFLAKDIDSRIYYKESDESFDEASDKG